MKKTTRDLGQINSSFFTKNFTFYADYDRKIKQKRLMEKANDNLKTILQEIYLSGLTTIRDYYIKKTINFMVYVKNMNGVLKSAALFEYDKNSKILYFRKAGFRDESTYNEYKMLIQGAIDSLDEYGFKPKGIIIDPDMYVPKSLVNELGLRAIVVPKNNLDKMFDRAKPDKIENTCYVYFKNIGRTKLSTKQLHEFISILEEGSKLKSVLSEIDKDNVNLKIIESDALIKELENMERD